MAIYKIETSLFDTIEYDSDNDLWEYYSITVDNTTFETRLSIEPDLDEHIDAIKAYLESIPQMIARAKETFVEGYASDETIQMFVNFQMEEIESESLLSCFEVGSVEEITPKLFLEALGLRGISIDYDGECLLDFCLDKDLTDALLVVRFDQELNITDIAHES